MPPTFASRLVVSSLFALVPICPLVFAADAPDESPPGVRPVDFAADVLPILREKCVACHGPSLKMGGLRLDRASFAREGGNSGLVIEPRKSAGSLLIQRILDEKLGVLMPPTGKLSGRHVDTLRAWIDQGASWPDDAVVITEQVLADVPLVARAFFAVLRTGDERMVRRMLADASLVKSTDRYGATPLMYAALHAGPDCIKLLLERGADPNASDRDGATALMWAARDLEKVRLLVEGGGDVNARSKLGRTPLLVASAHAGNAEVVRFLLRAGAAAAIKDQRGATPLTLAARTRDAELLRTLLDAGTEANAPARDDADWTAIAEAAEATSVPGVRLLLERGAKGKALDRALVLAAMNGSTEIVRLLLDRSADPNARLETDGFPQRPLVAAAYSDHLNADVVRLLLQHGADPSIKDARGKTPIDYAAERGPTRIVDLLSETRVEAKSTPQPEAFGPDSVRRAAQKSLALLQSCGPTFSARGGGTCAACHQQTAASFAVGLARTRGLPVDEKVAAEQVQVPARELETFRAGFLQRVSIGGTTHRIAYLLLGMHAEGYPADDATDAAVLEIAGLQTADGCWISNAHRPPSEYSEFSATAVCVRAMQVYAPPSAKVRAEIARRIHSARDWLLGARPRSNQDHAFHLLGLRWAGADHGPIAAAAAALLHEQLADGGWEQLPGLKSDAYATGLSLYALQEGRGLDPAAKPYQRGVRFLLSTQQDDGSWHVRSRSYKFQPFFESGFPHGHDQWISAAGTGWAAMGLILAMPSTASFAEHGARAEEKVRSF